MPTTIRKIAWNEFGNLSEILGGSSRAHGSTEVYNSVVKKQIRSVSCLCYASPILPTERCIVTAFYFNDFSILNRIRLSQLNLNKINNIKT